MTAARRTGPPSGPRSAVLAPWASVAMAIVAGCVARQPEPAGAGCIRDYDGCLDLAVAADICQSIYDACIGHEVTTTDAPMDGGCWDEVQSCLEANDGDEAACATLIEQCIGAGTTGSTGASESDSHSETTSAGCPDGNCPGETQTGSQTSPEPEGCTRQLAECIADGNEGSACAAQLPDCMIGEACISAIENCVQSGASVDECVSQYPTCDVIDEPPDDCQTQYEACLERQPERICVEQLQACTGGPDPDDTCWQIAEGCASNPEVAQQGTCDTISQRCRRLPPSDACENTFFRCSGGAPPRLDWSQVPAECYVQYADCS